MDIINYTKIKKLEAENAALADLVSTNQDIKLTNEVLNGDFSNGTTGWIANGGSISATDNTLTHTANGTLTTPYTEHGIPSIIYDNKYYMRSKVTVTNSDCLQIYITGGSPLVYVAGISNPIANETYVISDVATALATGGLGIRVRHRYIDTATANGKELKIQEVSIIDLSKLFGVGNEPTKEEMDELIEIIGWFDGEITLTQKQTAIWTLNMIRQNRAAIIASGGTIV